MSFGYRLSRVAMKIGAIISCAVILESTVAWNVITAKADTSGCHMELVGDPCGGKGSCTCGGKDMDIYAINQMAGGDPLNANWANYEYGGGATIGFSGCLATSIYISCKMSGVFGDMCPLGFFKMMTNSKFFDGAGLSYAPFSKLQDKDGNKSIHFIWCNDELINNIATSGLGHSSTGSLSHETAYKLAVDLAKQGAYVTVKQTHPGSDHWTPVTKVVDSTNELGATLIVSNVGDQNDDPINGKHGSWIKYKSKDTAPSEDYLEYTAAFPADGYKGLNEMVAIVIDGHPFTGDTAGSGTKTDAGFTYKGFCKFLEEEYFIDVNKLEEASIPMPVRSDLIQSSGVDKVKEIESWKSNIDNNKENSINRYIRASFMFVGILITLYSMLLYVAYQFDRINNFVDISLLSTMTVGRLNVAPEDTNGNFNSATSGRAKYLKHKDIIIVSIIGVGIGVLLISGRIFSLMWGIKEFLDKLFG